MDDPWADAPPSKPSTPAPPRLSSDAQPSVTDTTAPAPSSPPSALRDASPSIAPQTRLGEPPADSDFDAPIDDTNDDVDPYAETSPPFATIPPPQPGAGGGDNDGFDDFDDFDAPAIAGPSGAGAEGSGGVGDDDFGDFDDFEEGGFAGPISEEAGEEPQATPPAAPIEPAFRSLSLSPFPSRPDLHSSLCTILGPLLPPPTSLTSEPLRDLPPARQILTTDGAREAYVQLASAPQIKPLDWTRSRVRREHLIAMGVPVNLDEVDSHRLSAMPPLTITTSFATRPAPGAGSGSGSGSGSMAPPARAASLDARGRASGERQSQTAGSRERSVVGGGGPMSAAPALGGSSRGKYGLGDKPELDLERAEELCGTEEDQLSLLQPAALKKLQDELVVVSAQASARLAWELQLKDGQSQDSATYNGMISELIANAAKAKSAQQVGSGGVFRRASARRPQSGSGHGTPRVSSPVIR